MRQKKDAQALRIKLRDLQMVQALAEAGSMAAAAERLALSQPAISKAMSELEHGLGAQLLDRSSRGVVLTESGRVLLERGRVILDEVRLGITEIDHLSDPTQGEVRVGTSDPAAVVVSEIINALSRRYPRITYQILIDEPTTAMRNLRERKTDVLVTRWIATDDNDDMKAEILYEAPLAVMTDHRHRLLRRKPISLADLMNEPWIHSPPDSLLGRSVKAIFGRNKLMVPPAAVTTNSMYMRLNLLATGRFLSILPVTMLRHPSNRAWLRALPVDLRDSGSAACITLKKRRPAGAVKLFVEESRAVCKTAFWAA
ncbi:MAG TPA: LysR family transcriptional regulator [Xanthobacteraceae bacterium]|jgi:DNA-binding transcriptional LysR family regulator